MKKYRGFKGSGYNAKKTKKRNKRLEQIADKIIERTLNQLGIEKKY